MAAEVAIVLKGALGAEPSWETVISTDHNHVSLERFGDRPPQGCDACRSWATRSAARLHG
jgi:hypothetical protein